jgi:hypothetical protein
LTQHFHKGVPSARISKTSYESIYLLFTTEGERKAML